MDKSWYKAKVIHGKKLAVTLGFPTLNLDNPNILSSQKEGVYACKVEIKGKRYKGVLYFGPRLILNETEKILEIFIFDFKEEIYEEIVAFQLVSFIREAMNFKDLESFKKQLVLDCWKARTILGQNR